MTPSNISPPGAEVTPTTTNGSLAEALALQIRSLQGGFRTLCGAGSLRDLGERFLRLLKESSAEGELALLYRRDTTWQILSGSSHDAPEALALPPEGCSELLADGREICCVQKLLDGSAAALRLRQVPGAPLYTTSDLVSVELFMHLFDNAYQALLARQTEKDLIFSLNHRVLQLNSLIDTGIEVAKLERESSPLSLALERATALTNASRGRVQVSYPGGRVEELAFPEGASDFAPETDGQRISSEFAFDERTYRFELFNKESRKGAQPFDETDQLLLEALSRQVHASLENRDLHAKALEKEKFERDLYVAASIQQKILPTSLPSIDGYDLAGVNIPTKSVGGDYYDCLTLPDGRYVLLIADVSGKGIPAALLVSSLHASLSAYLESTPSLLDLTRRLNRAIGRASTDDKFITAFFALLTPATGELITLNAGHTSTLLLKRDGTLEELSAGGVPLGMLDIDFPYETQTIKIASGDRLLLYTDGITEASDSENQLYDNALPLKEFFASHKPERAESFLQELIADIRKFTGDAPQNDDITALYLLRR
jgi:serine phosphatase RsbU (regulator of sigma subunit)